MTGALSLLILRRFNWIDIGGIAAFMGLLDAGHPLVAVAVCASIAIASVEIERVFS